MGCRLKQGNPGSQLYEAVGKHIRATSENEEDKINTTSR